MIGCCARADKTPGPTVVIKTNEENTKGEGHILGRSEGRRRRDPGTDMIKTHCTYV